MVRNFLLILAAFTSLMLASLVLGGCIPPTPVVPNKDPNEVKPSGFVPESPECIAPANVGGGWDFTCRSAANVFNESGLIKPQFTLTNLPGGGGGVAFSHVVRERNDDDSLIVAASPATTLRIAQAQYGDFTENDVRWLGAVAADFAVLAVAADSPYEQLDDLITVLRSDPEQVNVGGGSAIGGQDHMKVLILAIRAGLEPHAINYTAFNGGGEALSALLDGFIDVFPGDASEVKAQVEAGQVRILATLTPQRLPAPFAQIPTANELGYPAEWIVFRGYLAPGNMSDEAYHYWGNALAELAQSAEWQRTRDEAGLGEFFLVGEAFEAYVKEQVQNFRQLSRDLGLID